MKVPDESPSVDQGSVSVSSTSCLPVSLSSPLQTALFQASKQGEDISSLGFKIKKGEYTTTPHNLLQRSLYTLNFLNVDKQGQTASERFWHPGALPFAEVRWRDPLTNQWNGPDPVLIWGRGHVCVFPRDAEDPRWVPECLVRFYGSGPNGEFPSLHYGSRPDGEFPPPPYEENATRQHTVRNLTAFVMACVPSHYAILTGSVYVFQKKRV